MINTLWLDVKYINLLSSSLRNFRQKDGTLYNFSCPICGDSQQSKTKARGFLIQRSGKFFFYCHNCNQSLVFSKLLQLVNPVLYDEYLLEKVSDSKQPVVAQPTIMEKFSLPKQQIKLPKVSQLPSTHKCKQYVVQRQIPSYFHSQLYYCKQFKHWVNSIKPDSFEDVTNDHPRLIIPLIDQTKTVFGIQGRAIGDYTPRYITIILDKTRDHLPSVYGIDRVDFNTKYYVFEGPIDSMFIPNSIACLGSSLHSEVAKLNKPTDNAVLVFDNQPRNEQVVRSMLTAASQRYKLCVWPDNIADKDINQMIIRKVSGPYCKTELIEKAAKWIQRVIDDNTFQGLQAELAIHQWKKI